MHWFSVKSGLTESIKVKHLYLMYLYVEVAKINNRKHNSPGQSGLYMIIFHLHIFSHSHGAFSFSSYILNLSVLECLENEPLFLLSFHSVFFEYSAFDMG